MRRELLPVLVIAAWLVGFASWTAIIVRDVAQLRAGVERRVSWIAEAGEIQRAHANGAHVTDVTRQLGVLELALAAERGGDDRAARAARDQRIGLTAPDHPLDLQAVIAALREDNAAASRALGDRWAHLQIVAATAIVMALALAGLAIYVIGVVRPRTASLLARTERAVARGRGIGHEVGGAMTVALTTMQIVRKNLGEGRGSTGKSAQLLDEAIAALERAGGSLTDARAPGDRADVVGQIRAERSPLAGDSSERSPGPSRRGPPSDDRRIPEFPRDSSEQARVAGAGDPPPSGVGAAATSTTQGYAALKILLIDDDAFVLSSVARVLKHDVVTAESDATQAIELAVNGAFDVILCDMMMPGKTGADVYREVVEQRADLADRFLFMSGGAVEREYAEFLDRAPARIDKPFGAQALRREIARVAGRPLPSDRLASQRSDARTSTQSDDTMPPSASRRS